MSYFQDLYKQWVGFPRSIKLFYGSDIFFGLAQAIFNTLFNLHLLSIGYTADHVGMLQSAASLVMAGIGIPVGLIGDRWGRRGLYVTGSLLFSVPYLVMPWLTNYPLLVAIYILGTVGNTLMLVNESPLLASEAGPERRASVFSFMMINFFIWNTLGIQLSGWLTNWLPAGGLSRYEWPLVAAGVCGVISGLMRAFLPFRQQVPSRRGLSLRPSKVTVTLALVSILAGAYMSLGQSFNNVVLAQRFGFTADTISTVLTVAGVVGWFGSLMVPWVSQRIGDLKGYFAVVTLQGLATIYLGLADVPGTFLPGFWARALLGTMQMSLFNAFAMAVTPDDERATANSYAMVGRNVGMAIASKGYGVALATGSFFLPFTLAGLCAVSTAVLTLMAFRRQSASAADLTGAQ